MKWTCQAWEPIDPTRSYFNYLNGTHFDQAFTMRHFAFFLCTITKVDVVIIKFKIKSPCPAAG